MQNTAPFNTDVPEFAPSREAPIYPSIVRRYPCQEDVAGLDDASCNANFRSLTWKIQQPDSSMVWTAVKLVLPMTMMGGNTHGDPVDMRVGTRLPACNVALAETVMKCFRDTQLTLNGKVFNEVNYYRDILDTCYRGVGPQSYGDNHSLKPVVTRALRSDQADQIVTVKAQDGAATTNHIRIDDVRHWITSNNESLLDNNGPFLERARLWQDGLSEDGTEWTGNVTAYLESGPFQARARKGNTAVPYIKDFHLKLNFVQNPSRYDQLRNVKPDIDNSVIIRGRTMTPRLLEFGTIPNMKVPGEYVNATNNFLASIATYFTQKPYLEVTYTKFLDPLRSSYLLRCYERQYHTSLPRFKLPPAVGGSGKKTARVTSRLLSYPTKIYLYAEMADEWKGSYLFGGVRRSCMLDNIHCRINQRPDVIYNPSQEECFETFQRHTNSSLEYGAWRKSPIYVFTPSDLRQSDMYANDARITWMEWDAEVSLTKLQNDEHMEALGTQAISAAGYVRGVRDEYSYVVKDSGGWSGGGDESVEIRMSPQALQTKHNDANLGIQWSADRTANSNTELPVPYQAALGGAAGCPALKTPYVQMVFQHRATGYDIPVTSEMDVQLTATASITQRLDGFIWALVETEGAGKGQFFDNAVYYMQKSFKFVPDEIDAANFDRYGFINSWELVEATPMYPNGPGTPAVWSYKVDAADYDSLLVAAGTIKERNNPLDGKKFGQDNANGNLKTISPGPEAYRFDAYGIRNKNATWTLAGDGGQDMTQMGSMKFAVAPNANEIQAANEKDDAKRSRWCCFAPPPSFVGGVPKEFQFISTTHETLIDDQSPVVHQAGDTVQTGYGRQRTFFYGTAANATIDASNQTQYDNRVSPNLEFGILEGRRMGELVVDPTATTDDIKFDYQMKALYEYGNCQYEFGADGTPSRVHDNLIPVGPSAGIPTF